MDFLQASERTLDKRVKAYKQGKELRPGYAYLCCCRKTFYPLLPWRSKQIYEVFEARVGDSLSEFFHVIVRRDEWYAWLRIEGTILQSEKAGGFSIAGKEEDEIFPSIEDVGGNLDVSLAVLLTVDDSGKLGVATSDVPFTQKEVKVPLPVSKKQTIEWQRWRLLCFLSRVCEMKQKQEDKKQRLEESKLRRQKMSEQSKQRKALRVEKTMENYARVDAEREKRRLEKTIGQDPNIDTYEYDLIIRIVGGVVVVNTGLDLKLSLKTGRYLARKCSTGTRTYLMMRDPSGACKIEYGLLLAEWLTLRRDDTVTIEGL